MVTDDEIDASERLIMPYLTLTRGGDRRFDRDAVLRWLEDRKAVAS
jgi:hypothetical protein